MSAKRRRSRGSASPQAGAGSHEAPKLTPLPEWRWRTFPVYLAFATGGFVGLYMGIIAANNTGFFFFASTFWALLVGLGFSRVSTRWIISRNWARRSKREKA